MICNKNTLELATACKPCFNFSWPKRNCHPAVSSDLESQMVYPNMSPFI